MLKNLIIHKKLTLEHFLVFNKELIELNLRLVLGLLKEREKDIKIASFESLKSQIKEEIKVLQYNYKVLNTVLRLKLLKLDEFPLN